MKKSLRLTLIAITHPHADHIGQLDKIIDAFDVDEVWMNGQSAESDVFLRALDAIEDNGLGYYEPEVGEVIDVGPLEIDNLTSQVPCLDQPITTRSPCA